jgi:nitrite reductase/ring-hydroxylating ferredoxin subunit
MTWHTVGRTEELAEGKHIVVKVDNKEIGVFREDDRYYAILNVCPHAYAPIAASGRVEPLLTAEGDGSYHLDKERKVLRCPWHHWEFELESGQAICHMKQRLRTFAVEAENGFIKVKL